MADDQSQCHPHPLLSSLPPSLLACLIAQNTHSLTLFLRCTLSGYTQDLFLSIPPLFLPPPAVSRSGLNYSLWSSSDKIQSTRSLWLQRREIPLIVQNVEKLANSPRVHSIPFNLSLVSHGLNWRVQRRGDKGSNGLLTIHLVISVISQGHCWK